ncbi:MAG: DUF2283 domain-containing protein [Chloroflexi bacterium]|nr:DUF2283 domain-containing protein [Chloroflexota bacterium]MBI3760663.1 DUF2283 domain-containing protein [Chloroflexota bacterium]
MRISYDRGEDVLTIELDASAPIDHAEHVGAVILHLSPDDRPVLIEILHASEFLSSLVKASMRAEPVTV